MRLLWLRTRFAHTHHEPGLQHAGGTAPPAPGVALAGGKADLAVLHYKPRASRFPGEQPDYYAELTDDWIVYPWDDER